MERKPRDPKEKLLTPRILIKSVIQGLVIFAASFGTYLTVLAGNEANAPVARTMGLAIIMLSNLLLVQVNSSECDFAFRSVIRLAKDKVMWGVNIFTIIGLAAILYTPLAEFLKLAPLSATQLFTAVGIAVAAVLWYEIGKACQETCWEKKGGGNVKNIIFHITFDPWRPQMLGHTTSFKKGRVIKMKNGVIPYSMWVLFAPTFRKHLPILG